MDLVLWFVAKSPFAIDQTRRTGQTVELTAARGSFADQEEKSACVYEPPSLRFKLTHYRKMGFSWGAAIIGAPYAVFRSWQLGQRSWGSASD
jgi:hypothetical protein